MVPDAELPLDETTWTQVQQSPELMAIFQSHASQPAIRSANGLLMIFQSVPFSILLGAIAMALFGLAKDSSPLRGANKWVRRAAVAALVTAIVPPLIPSVQASLLMAGTPQGPTWIFTLDVGVFLEGLLLASAAAAVAWAMTAATKAQAELDRFV